MAASRSDILIPGYEQVVLHQDTDEGLRCIVALHSTALGPAIGGVRLHPYPSDLAALGDALRLAKGMTYKAAAAGLRLGGGKAVVIADPERKTPALMRAFGRVVESFGGRYITAEDVGTSVEDMDLVAEETASVVGRSTANGGSGDPSPMTALGVFRAHQVVAMELDGLESLEKTSVVVQGAGRVGYQLCRLLAEAGARLHVADLDPAAAARAAADFGARVVEPGWAHVVDCDIFAPCALGAVINDDTLPQLRCRAVAGAANNVLASPAHGEALHRAGILYAPDYLINAGGMIHVADELHGYSAERVLAGIDGISDTLATAFRIARSHGVSTSEAADRIAERRLRAAPVRVATPLATGAPAPITPISPGRHGASRP